MTKIPYWQKLQDPRWQKRRLDIMSRDGFKCKECGSGDKKLAVHHSYYKKGVEPWEYPDDALHTVCDDCHEERASSERHLLETLCWADPVEICELASVISLALNRGWAFQNIIDDLRNSDVQGRLPDLLSTAESTMANASNAGVKLEVRGEFLALTPAINVNPELRAQLIAHKKEIIDILSQTKPKALMT